jgi:two-component system chemotaxis response regulator CheY
MKILIVDDSRAMRSIVMRTLRQAGFTNHPIQEATNGAEGLKAVQETHPDLVLSDFNMPIMDGLKLLQSLRSEGLSTQFGFVTSESSAELREAAIAAGASFVITKPFTPEVFRSVLEPLFAAHA